MIIKFYFKDSSTKIYSDASKKHIRGIRDSNGNRPSLIIVKGSEDEVTLTFKENYYKSVLPSLDPLIGQVLVVGTARKVLI